MEKPIWLNKTNFPYNNLRINPGLRHSVRLRTSFSCKTHDKTEFQNVQIKIVQNSNGIHSQSLVFLNELRNLYVRQLPKMGNSYITRLVFDYGAETQFILYNGKVTGAVTSKLFKEERFVEVVFLSVDAYIQGSGFGRLIINYLKSTLQVYGFKDILACADLEAVNFFRKQGFNDKEIAVEPERWLRRIKDYTGIQLCHCIVDQRIDYFRYHSIVKKQIEKVEEIYGKKFISYPKELKNIFKPYIQSPNIKCISYDQIKKVTDDVFEPPSSEKKLKDIKKKIENIMAELEEDQKLSSIFTYPVTEIIAPGYFSVINRPMDFLTIRKRLNINTDYFYKRPEMFASDIVLIADNCRLYNQPGSSYTNTADILISKFKVLYKEFFPDYPYFV